MCLIRTVDFSLQFIIYCTTYFNIQLVSTHFLEYFGENVEYRYEQFECDFRGFTRVIGRSRAKYGILQQSYKLYIVASWRYVQSKEAVLITYHWLSSSNRVGSPESDGAPEVTEWSCSILCSLKMLISTMTCYISKADSNLGSRFFTSHIFNCEISNSSQMSDKNEIFHSKKVNNTLSIDSNVCIEGSWTNK